MNNQKLRLSFAKYTQGASLFHIENVMASGSEFVVLPQEPALTENGARAPLEKCPDADLLSHSCNDCV